MPSTAASTTHTAYSTSSPPSSASAHRQAHHSHCTRLLCLAAPVSTTCCKPGWLLQATVLPDVHVISAALLLGSMLSTAGTQDIIMLTDDATNQQLWPTKANMIHQMQRLVSDAQPGDSLVFHYSGTHKLFGRVVAC